MTKITDDGEIEYSELDEKRKNEQLQREHEKELERMRTGNQRTIAFIGFAGVLITALCGLIGVFVPVVSLPSSPPGEREPILSAIILLLLDDVDDFDEETPTPDVPEVAAATITPIIPTDIIVSATPQSLATPTVQNTPSSVTATPVIPTVQGASPSPDLTNLCPPIGDSQAIFAEPFTEYGDIVPSAGSGIFSSPIRPFGNIPTEYLYVREMLENTCTQWINPSTLGNRQATRQCMVSMYDTNLIWTGTVRTGISILIRRSDATQFTNVGTVTRIAPDARAFLVRQNLSVGDEICVEAPNGTTLGEIGDAGGYHLWIGRDLTMITDSWCMMLENDGRQHFCQFNTGEETSRLSPVLVEMRLAEPGEQITYTATLSDNEVIVGNAQSIDIANVRQSSAGCIAYVIQGPGTYSVSLRYGSIKHYSNTPMQEAETLFQTEIDNLISYSTSDNISGTCGSDYTITEIRIP